MCRREFRGPGTKAKQWWLDFEEQIGLHDAGDTGRRVISRLPFSDVTRIESPWTECVWRPRSGDGGHDFPRPPGSPESNTQRSLRILNAHVDPHATVGGQLEQLEMLIGEAEAFNGRRSFWETSYLIETEGYRTRNLLSRMVYSRRFLPGLRPGVARVFVCTRTGYSLVVWKSQDGSRAPLNVSDHWPIWPK